MIDMRAGWNSFLFLTEVFIRFSVPEFRGLFEEVACCWQARREIRFNEEEPAGRGQFRALLFASAKDTS